MLIMVNLFQNFNHRSNNAINFLSLPPNGYLDCNAMSDLFKHPSLLWGRKRNSAPNNSTTHFFVVVKLSTFCVRLIWIVLILLRKFVQLPLFYTQRKKIIRIGSAIRKTMCKNYYDYCIQFF